MKRLIIAALLLSNNAAPVLLAKDASQKTELSKKFSQIQLVALRCEYRTNPMGIDTTTPRFGRRIEVPPNSSAKVYLPAGGREGIKESGRVIERTEGVTFMGMENGRAVMRVVSGHYSFVSMLDTSL